MHWLVSLPLTGSKDDTWSSLQQLAMYHAPLAECHKFSIPELRVRRALNPKPSSVPIRVQVCCHCYQT